MAYSSKRHKTDFLPSAGRSAFPPRVHRKPFDRAVEVPGLIGLWPSDLNNYSRDGTAMIVALLRKALRSERRRGNGGHWTYDLNRHIALAEALKIETARLRQHIEDRQPAPAEKQKDRAITAESW